MEFLAISLLGSYLQTLPQFLEICLSLFNRLARFEPAKDEENETLLKEKRQKRSLHFWQIIISTLVSFFAYGWSDTLRLYLFVSILFCIFHAPLALRLKQSIVWILCFLWLSALHIERPPTAQIHLSGSVMLLVIKMTTYACEVETRPNLVPFFAWVMFIPSFLVGPTLTYEEYQKWVDNVVEKKTRGPRMYTAIFINYLLQLIFFGLNHLLIHYFPLSSLYDEDISLRPNTWTKSFIHAWIALWSIRCKYYFVWTFSELMYRVSGADDVVSHKGVNVHPLKVESASGTFDILNNWNLCTNTWLKKVVYENVKQNFQSNLLAIVATNIVSAFWHGFAPGYYATFLSAGFCTYLGRMIHTRVEPRVAQPLKQLFKFILFSWTIIVSVTFSLPFQVLTWNATWQSWLQLRFVGHVIAVATFILVQIY